MVEGRAVSLIGGLVGEQVEFTIDGIYRVGRFAGVSRYQIKDFTNPPELDIWIPDMRPLVTRCIYSLVGDELTICIAANNGERPIELKRDDQTLWCIKTLKRRGK